MSTPDKPAPQPAPIHMLLPDFSKMKNKAADENTINFSDLSDEDNVVNPDEEANAPYSPNSIEKLLSHSIATAMNAISGFANETASCLYHTTQKTLQPNEAFYYVIIQCTEQSKKPLLMLLNYYSVMEDAWYSMQDGGWYCILFRKNKFAGYDKFIELYQDRGFREVILNDNSVYYGISQVASTATLRTKGHLPPTYALNKAKDLDSRKAPVLKNKEVFFAIIRVDELRLEDSLKATHHNRVIRNYVKLLTNNVPAAIACDNYLLIRNVDRGYVEKFAKTTCSTLNSMDKHLSVRLWQGSFVVK